jgi:predicted enzyme related to lactoylglutathione lyase
MAGAGVTCAATAEQPCFKQTGYRRPLHWVFKVGDLKATLEFYERVFGMKARAWLQRGVSAVCP